MTPGCHACGPQLAELLDLQIRGTYCYGLEEARAATASDLTGAIEEVETNQAGQAVRRRKENEDLDWLLDLLGCDVLKQTTLFGPNTARPLPRATLRANIDETESAAIITERGGQENHRERSQSGSSFCSQFA